MISQEYREDRKAFCEKCYFGEPDGKKIKCRRMPAAVLKDPKDWCGEFKDDRRMPL